MFKKYRNYLLSIMDLAGVKSISVEEFIGHVTFITKDFFGEAEGKVYRSLTENEAKILWLEASLSMAVNSPAFSYVKKAEDLTKSLDAKLLESYPLLSIFNVLKPNSVFGNLSMALTHDVLVEATQSGFLPKYGESMILGFSIENDSLCFTFYPIKVLEERLKHSKLMKFLCPDANDIAANFDLENWNPSPSQMKN